MTNAAIQARKVFTEEEKIEFLKNQSYANGIMKHEFSDEIIEAGEITQKEMNQRIFNGESTLEEEEEKLLKVWKQLHA